MTRITRYCSSLPRLPILMILFFCATSVVEATDPSDWGDGWHRWTVPAVNQAPGWCCFDYAGGTPRPVVCELGSQDNYYHAPDGTSTDAINIFVAIENGRISNVQALAANCPVKADSPVSVHDGISAEQSAGLLQSAINPRNGVSSSALAAISMHEGKTASRILLQTARKNTDLENRKDAVFWIGQVRAEELSVELKQLMFDDASAELREHAAFSLSQSSLPDRTNALARLGSTDENKSVRGQAWFWLSQLADKDAEAALKLALSTESSAAVRQEIVFAQSQLPGDRGVNALIKVIEDLSLSRVDRKQAMFWLAQSKSEQAYDYLSNALD